MKEFLKSVAEHYFGAPNAQALRAEDWLKVTDHLFVFPSRRSGLFFAQYLLDVRNAGKKGVSTQAPVFSPEITTIADLFSCFTKTRLADHTQLLFIMYEVYNKVMAEAVAKSHEQGNTQITYRQEDFDNFIFWGDMLLNDFADVDRYLADARLLFLNVRDLKEIEEFMGGEDESLKRLLESFWGHINPQVQTGDVKASFCQTWSILFDLYTQFKAALQQQGIAYDGMLQREVVEAIPSGNLDPYLERLPKHIVFVGITAINEAERKLLKWLKEKGVAEFCWDYADNHLRTAGSKEKQALRAHASYFTQRNLEDFPNALSDEELIPYLVPEEEREITTMPIPSGVGQTNEAANILNTWGNQDAIHTAVILADESLLVPMCYAIPGAFEHYNVTMGYSLRSTQTFALVEALSDLQNNYRQSTRSYYYKNVLAVLGHSFIVNLAPEASNMLSSEILKQAIYQVPFEKIRKASPLFEVIFKPSQSREDVKKYLREVFNELLRKPALDDEESLPDITDLERESLLCFSQELDHLLKQIEASKIETISRQTIFRLLLKLAGSQMVSFSGEPLSGLQVMGILETRALDFERIILLSMNEGTFPAKPSQNSFIPISLRNAFGLPTQQHKDSVLAYHFYRLISRAKKVVLMYDNRTTGMKSGEESRYLLQLKYLSNSKITIKTPTMNISTQEQQDIVVEKTPEVLEKLEAFKSGIGKRNLSASSLKKYISCPLQFYFQQVEGLREQDDIADEIADNQFGDILHKAMELLFEEALGKRLFSDNIKNLIQSGAVEKAIDRAFKAVMPNAEKSGYFQLVLNIIRQYVEGILQHDAALAPMTYLASEGKQVVEYPVADGLTVNLKAVYDRLDIVVDEQNRGVLRVVDYKTGSPSNKQTLGTMEELFAEKGKGSKEAFQVLFYCLMLKYATEETKQELNLSPQTMQNSYVTIQPNLYFSRNFTKKDSKLNTKLSVEKVHLDDFETVESDFEAEMKKLLMKIFDKDEPFRQCNDSHTCSYCAFSAICGR